MDKLKIFRPWFKKSDKIMNKAMVNPNNWGINMKFWRRNR